ncbi:hypothetical protein HDE_02731 [Halotydeus destructor]|nr:hypothetical protein HDE_02731 [Halotydeus destructor]
MEKYVIAKPDISRHDDISKEFSYNYVDEFNREFYRRSSDVDLGGDNGAFDGDFHCSENNMASLPTLKEEDEKNQAPLGSFAVPVTTFSTGPVRDADDRIPEVRESWALKAWKCVYFIFLLCLSMLGSFLIFVLIASITSETTGSRLSSPRFVG